MGREKIIAQVRSRVGEPCKVALSRGASKAGELLSGHGTGNLGVTEDRRLSETLWIVEVQAP